MWPRTLWAAGVVEGVLGVEEGVERTLGVDDEHGPARQLDGDIRPAAAFLGVGGGLFGEVVVLGEAGGVEDVPEGLLAPAALDPGPAAQGGGKLAGLVLGGGRGGHQSGDLFLESAGLLGPGLLHGHHLLLEPGQGLGHRLELGLQSGLGQLFAVMEGLVGALQHLVGDGAGGLGVEEGGVLGALLLDDAHPHRGVLQLPGPGLGAIGPASLHHRPGETDAGGQKSDQGDEKGGVHGAFLARVGRRRQPLEGC
jgi:hypothetical protein